MPTVNYIPKEFGLDNNTLKPGEEILYSSWTITLLPSGEIVKYVERDDVNKTSKLFTDVFILGNTYSVKMSLVTTNGPTIDTEPFIITITDNKDIIDLYPIPAVVDTPIVSMPYDANNIPNTNIVFNVSDIIVSGNAVLKSVDWVLMDDNNKIVFRSLKDEINLKSITIKDMILDSNTAYTMYCILKANNRDSSGAGGITFRCVSLPELDIQGDLRDSFFTLPIETNLKNTLPNLVKFDFELYGEDQVLLYTGTNNNGKITIPAYKVDNSYMLDKEDGYDYYSLKIKATTNTNIYGWREYIFKPKEWIVESNRNDDTTIVYNNRMDQVSVDIEGFDSASFDFTKYKGMAGGIFQMPDDTFIISYKYKKYGLFKYSEDKTKFIKINDINFSFIVDSSLNTSNSWYQLSYLTPAGIIAVVPLDANIENYIYFLRYNTIKKEFSLINKTTGGIILYLNDHIMLMKDGVSICTYNINTNEKTAVLVDPFTDTTNRWSGVIDTATRRKVKMYSHTKINATEIDGRSFILNIAEDYKSATAESMVNEVLYPSSINSSIKYFSYALLKNNNTLIYTHDPVLNHPMLSIKYSVKGIGLNNFVVPEKQIDIKQNQLSFSRFNTIFHFNNGNKLLMSLTSPQTSLLFS